MIRPEIIRSRSLEDLAHYLGAEGRNISGVEISGVTNSSKDVISGDLFIAIPGAVQHGASFAESAAKSGAVAILTDTTGSEIAPNIPALIVKDVRSAAGLASAWLYDEPMRSLNAVGVTGTNGKTTVTYLVHQLLMKAGRESGLIGTIESRIGLERIESSRTTPEAADLQALSAVMRERHMRHLVMEVSSHSIALKRIKGSFFKVLAFTNLTQDHLDFHPSMEHYFQTKASLFTQEYGEVGLINIDDPYGHRLAAQTNLPKITISRGNTGADWHYISSQNHGKYTHFSARGPYGILIESKTQLQGAFNFDNLLMAIAIVEYLGIDPLEIAAMVPELVGAPGRLEPVSLGQPFKALVDYAHSPDAVQNVLRVVREFTDGKVIAVLGCGGDRDASKRPLMGRALIEGSDIAIFTSDNPRSEHPADILSQMTEGLEIRAPHAVIEDRKGAITEAVASARAGDTVIILGKGHENGQEFKGVVTPFDDRLVLAHAIEAKP